MTDDTDWLARRKRYRRLLYGVLGVGIVGFFLADRGGRPIVAVGIYWAGVLGFFAVRRFSSVALFDERDRTLERRASHDALRLAGAALIIAAPAAFALSETGRYEPPPPVDGVLLGYAALSIVFGAAYLLRRARS
jgi:uncharacterized membrane protein